MPKSSECLTWPVHVRVNQGVGEIDNALVFPLL